MLGTNKVVVVVVGKHYVHIHVQSFCPLILINTSVLRVFPPPCQLKISNNLFNKFMEKKCNSFYIQTTPHSFPYKCTNTLLSFD